MAETGPRKEPDEAMLDLLIKQVTEGLSPEEQRELDVLDNEVASAYARDLEHAGDPAATLPLQTLLGALHATEHAQIAVLPLIAMCDRWDIGGLSTNAHPQTGGPTIFIYDGHPGGIGITRRGFDEFERLVDDARRLIGECPCAAGCPSCVQSPKCGNLNEPLSKRGALELLRRLTGPRTRTGPRALT